MIRCSTFLVLVMLCLGSSCTTAEMESAPNSPDVNIQNPADGTASALVGGDRGPIFVAMQKVLEDRGQLLGTWRDSGRIEAVVDATSILVTLAPIQSDLTRLIVQAKPLAGSGDVTSIASSLLAQGLADLTGAY